MQPALFLTLLLVAAAASAAPSQPESQASNTGAVVSSSQAQGSSAAGSSSPVVGAVGASPVESAHSASVEQVAPHHVPSSYYSPAGIINVVGVGEQQQPQQSAVVSSASAANAAAAGANNKPTVRSFEQYGQPESASLPANYKPFGSWGLYIGGQPADGYYTNYYKSVSSADKQQQAGQVGQAGPVGVVSAVAPDQQASVKPFGVGQAAFAPIQKQMVQGSSPQVGSNDYYSFAYSPSDFNSGVMQSVSQSASGAQAGSAAAVNAGGPVVYNGPPSASYDPSGYASGVSYYAPEVYATKKMGAIYGSQKEQAAAAPKSYQQSRVYVYPSGPFASPPVAVGHMSAPAQPAGVVASPQQPQQQQVAAAPAQPQQPQQPQYHHYSQQQPQQQVQHAPAAGGQVVSYPVPVGSQIVGSQPGVEGSFSPYGVHGFTRYAFKPTMVSQDPSYYYGAPSSGGQQQQYVQTYKQQQSVQQYQPQQPQYAAVAAYPSVGAVNGAAAAYPNAQQSAAPSSQADGTYYPMSFYGYPMNQLHYSQGSIVPSAQAGEGAHYAPMASPQVDSVADKADNEDKAVHKQQ